MSSLDRTVNSGVQYLYQLWDENSAAAGGIVFIPSLLVGAAHFSGQVVYYGTSPCYWLFVDVLILCYTVAVVTACLDIAADLYCFIARVHGDSIPLIVGKDNAVPYPKSFNQRIFWAMVFRVIGSTFALLLLTSATAMTLLPIAGIPGPGISNNSTAVTIPIQCTILSDPTYHFNLFFGFSVVAVIFAGLRFAFVHQSKKNGHEDHHHHNRPHHDRHNDDFHHDLVVVSTPPKSDDKKVGVPPTQPEKDLTVIVPPASMKEAEGKPSEEKEADEKDESTGESEDSEERKKKRRDRRRKRRERRERRKRDDGSEEDNDDD